MTPGAIALTERLSRQLERKRASRWSIPLDEDGEERRNVRLWLIARLAVMLMIEPEPRSAMWRRGLLARIEEAFRFVLIICSTSSTT